MKNKTAIFFVVMTLAFWIYGMFFVDQSGYYKVINENGAMVHNSVFVSDKDSIWVMPFDTVVKIESFEGMDAAEMDLKGQTVYVKQNDLELVKKTYDLWRVMQYFFYFILLCIALNLGYKYLRKHHVKLLSMLKTGVYVLITVAIIGIMINILNSPAEPPRFSSEAKSKLITQLKFEGYTPELNSEVDVLCRYDKYDFLVRDATGLQFVVPLGGLEAKIERLDDFNEEFTYNVSKKKLDSYMGKEIWQFVDEVGDFVTGFGLVYDFPYLIAIENGERTKGLKIVTNVMGVIQDIQYNDKEKSSNIFNKLPFYETIACKNMYISINITGDNNFWERLFAVVGNFFLLGFVVMMIARTASVITHWMGERNFGVKKSVKVLIWVVCAPFVYIYSIALLDFYHSWWIIVLFYIFSVITMTFEVGTENAAKSIYKCPSCGNNGVYAPQERVIRRTHIKTLYDWVGGTTERGIKVPKKICTLDVDYVMEGRCKGCGFVDNEVYTRQETVTGVTKCPLCGSKLKISEENGVHFEKCTKCDFTVNVIKVQPESRPVTNRHDVQPKDVDKAEPDFDRKERERTRELDNNFFKSNKEESKNKAKIAYNDYLNNKAKARNYRYIADNCSNEEEAKKYEELACNFDDEAKKSYDDYERNDYEAEANRKQIK